MSSLKQTCQIIQKAQIHAQLTRRSSSVTLNLSHSKISGELQCETCAVLLCSQRPLNENKQKESLLSRHSLKCLPPDLERAVYCSSLSASMPDCSDSGGLSLFGFPLTIWNSV